MGENLSAARWHEGLAQLSLYSKTKLVRASEQQNKNQTLYGFVNVGPHIRFYLLHAGYYASIEPLGTDDSSNELTDDEQSTHDRLKKLVRLT